MKRVRESSKRFKSELKKSTVTAIVAAFSFLIALSWKDVITGYVNQIEKISPIKGNLVSAIIVTFVSVIGILVVTRIFSEKNE